eukprot:gene30429-39672_t
MKSSDMFDDDGNNPPANPSFSNNFMSGMSPFRVNGSPISRNNNSSFYGSIPSNNWGYDARYFPPMQGYPMPPMNTVTSKTDDGKTSPGKSLRNSNRQLDDKVVSMKKASDLPLTNLDVSYQYENHNGDSGGGGAGVDDAPELQRRISYSPIKNRTSLSNTSNIRSQRFQQMDSLLAIVSVPQPLAPPIKRTSLSASKPAIVSNPAPSSSPSAAPSLPAKINVLSGDQVRSKRSTLAAPIGTAVPAPKSNTSNQQNLPNSGTKRKAGDISVTKSSINKDADDDMDIDIGSDSENDSDSDSAEEPARSKQVAHRGSHPTTKATNKNSEIIKTGKNTKSKSKKDSNITEKEKSRKGKAAAKVTKVSTAPVNSIWQPQEVVALYAVHQSLDAEAEGSEAAFWKTVSVKLRGRGITRSAAHCKERWSLAMREAQQRREKKQQAMGRVTVGQPSAAEVTSAQPSKSFADSASNGEKSGSDSEEGQDEEEDDEDEEEEVIVKPTTKKQGKSATVNVRTGKSSSNSKNKKNINVWQLIESHQESDETAKVSAPKQQGRALRDADTDSRGRRVADPMQVGVSATSEPKQLSFIERLKQAPLDTLQPMRKPSSSSSSTSSSSASTTSATSGVTSAAASLSSGSRSVPVAAVTAASSSSSSSSSSISSFRPSRYSSSDSLMSPSITSPAPVAAPPQRGPAAADSNKAIVERNINRKIIYTELFNSLLKK